MKKIKNFIKHVAWYTYKHRVVITNILLWTFFIIQISSLCNLYSNYKKGTEFVTKVSPILEEMDTTYSLRNYEVMRVKLYDEVKRWEEENYEE